MAKPPRTWAALVAALAVAVAAFWFVRNQRVPESAVDPVARACALDKEILVRLWRGHHPVSSEDVTMVPREPNFIGTFDLVSHSGPWDYLQRIPLVFYGPGHIGASGQPVDGAANIVDVYPTVERLLDVDLPDRDGRPLVEALTDSTKPPKLVLVVVWDGAGRATLDRWPDRWPTLARLEREGTSFLDATVGTSPSVTSAVHSSLGTGAWPRSHRVTGNDLRQRGGGLEEAFTDRSAEALTRSTFADEADRAYGNSSKVGLLGWTPWHVGMLGHGTASEGGDADELALIEYRHGIRITGNEDHFSTPRHLGDSESIDRHLVRLDRRDGRVDQEWLGHDISLDGGITWLTYSNPAWAAYQQDLLEEMIDAGGYGRDEIPDFLLTNFKMTDLAGHRWALDSQETAAALEAQDKALRDTLSYLDREIGDYVVVVTADHGHSATPASTGAWPIVQDLLKEDLDDHFGVDGSSDLVDASSAFGLYLDYDVMDEVDVTPEQVASFLNGYTIEDNWGQDDLPSGYEQRGDERVFSASFSKNQFDGVMRCAFGAGAPPKHDRA